jgi:RNA chaperone Hfq
MDSETRPTQSRFNNRHSRMQDFQCTDPFLNGLRKDGVEVDLYLKTGVHLIGVVLQFDEKGIVFSGGPRDEEPKEQLIFRTAIASIIPKQEQEGDHA